MEDVGAVLHSILAVTEEMVKAVDQEELDLDRVVRLIERRNELFAKLQDTFGVGDSTGSGSGHGLSDETRAQMGRVDVGRIDMESEHQEIVQQILALDRTCMEAVRSHLTQMQSALGDVKLRQRTMKAYGWVDPEFAPRGAFVDYKGR